MELGAVLSLRDKLSAQMEKASQATSGMVDRVNEADAAVQQMSQSSNAAASIQSNMTAISSSVDKVTSSATSASNELADMGGKKDLLHTVGDAVMKAGDNMQGFVDKAKQAPGTLADIVKNTSPVKTLGSAFGTVKDKVNEAREKLKDAGKYVGEVTDHIPGVKNLKEGFSSLASAGVQTAKQKLKEMGAQLKENLKDSNLLTNALKSVGSAAGKALAGGLKVIAAGTAAATIAVTAFGVASTNTFMGFDDSMRQVQATMSLTASENAAEIQMLTDAAKEAGKTTKFSASESADALNYLALAGYDAEKAVETMPKVLNLAAAGNLDLAYASDLVTDSMAALGLGTDELDSYIDKMAKTSQKANTDIAQLGEATLVVAGQARLANMSVTDMNTALGILADNGIKGSEGGTALRNVLKNLTAPTDNAAKMMDSLGLQIYDAEGNMRDMQDILVDLNGALDGLSDQQRNEAMSTIFDSRTIAGASALLNNCTDRWDELSEAIDDSKDTAQQMADTLEGGLGGSMRTLKSAVEGLQIEFGEKLAPSVGGAIDVITGYVNQLSDGMVGGIDGVMDAINSILGDVIQQATSVLPQFLGFGTQIIITIITGLVDAVPQLVPAAIEVLQTLVQAMLELLPVVIGAAFDILLALGDGIVQALPVLIPAAIDAIMSLVDGLTENLPMLMEAALAIITSLAQGIVDLLPQLIPAAVQAILTFIMGLVEALPTLITSAIDIILALVQGILDALPLILETGPQIIAKLIEAIVGAIPQLIDAAINLVMSLVEYILGNLDLIIMGGIQLIVALATGLLQAIPSLLAIIPKLLVAIIETILTTNWLEVGAQIVIGIAKGLLGAVTAIYDAVKNLVSGVVGWFKKLLGIGGDGGGAEVTHEIGTATGQGFKEGMEDTTEEVAAVSENLVAAATDNLVPDTAAISDIGADVSGAFADGINANAGEAFDAANFLSSGIEDFGSAEVNVNFNDVDTAALEAAMPIMEDFKATGSDVFQTMTQEVENFVAVISAIDLHDAGRNVMDGLIRGMESMEGKLLETAQRIADSVSSTVKEALDIHSPSRVMQDVGVNTVEGMIVGGESMLPDVAELGQTLGGAVSTEAENSGNRKVIPFPKPSGYDGLSVAQPSETTNNYGDSYSSETDRSTSKKSIVINNLIGKAVLYDEADEDRLVDKMINKLADLVDEADDNTGTEEEAV